MEQFQLNFLSFFYFLVIGGIGATAFFLTLIVIGRSINANSFGFLSVSIGLLLSATAGGIASAAVSLLPLLFEPQHLGSDVGVLGHIDWANVNSFMSMLIGMSASYFNRSISERRSTIEELQKKGELRKPGIQFDVWDFVQPFFVSLITFGAINARVQDNSLWTNVLIGFQTGFFWQTTLSNRVPGLGQKA